MNDFWRKQEASKPLFDDVLWDKPERRDQAGRLAIVGGNAGGFWAVAMAYKVALSVGIGQIRVIMPDALRSKLPRTVLAQVDDMVLTPSNPSGGLAKDSIKTLNAAANWCGNLLFIGDSGANAETAQLFDEFLTNNDEARVTIARDAVDLLTYSAESVLNRKNTHLIVSLGQFQKLARAVYYPRMITFSQGIRQVAETLHKFTITYPCAITLFHDGNLFIAHRGDVVSQSFVEPLRVWNGEVPTREAVWSVWQADILKASATAWVEL